MILLHLQNAITHKKRVDAQRFYVKVGMVNHHLKFTDELVPVSLL